jgi:hypothetical protein
MEVHPFQTPSSVPPCPYTLRLRVFHLCCARGERQWHDANAAPPGLPQRAAASSTQPGKPWPVAHATSGSWACGSTYFRAARRALKWSEVYARERARPPRARWQARPASVPAELEKQDREQLFYNAPSIHKKCNSIFR